LEFPAIFSKYANNQKVCPKPDGKFLPFPENTKEKPTIQIACGNTWRNTISNGMKFKLPSHRMFAWLSANV
jgi:hypothetical protein